MAHSRSAKAKSSAAQRLKLKSKKGRSRSRSRPRLSPNTLILVKHEGHSYTLYKLGSDCSSITLHSSKSKTPKCYAFNPSEDDWKLPDIDATSTTAATAATKPSKTIQPSTKRVMASAQSKPYAAAPTVTNVTKKTQQPPTQQQQHPTQQQQPLTRQQQPPKAGLTVVEPEICSQPQSSPIAADKKEAAVHAVASQPPLASPPRLRPPRPIPRNVLHLLQATSYSLDEEEATALLQSANGDVLRALRVSNMRRKYRFFPALISRSLISFPFPLSLGAQRQLSRRICNVDYRLLHTDNNSCIVIFITKSIQAFGSRAVYRLMTKLLRLV
jgi:hypothetical protein